MNQKLFAPATGIWGKNGIGSATGLNYLVLMKDHMVFECMESCTMGSSKCLNVPIALAGIGFVIGVDVYVGNAIACKELAPHIQGFSMKHQQFLSQLAQLIGNVFNSPMDKCHTLIAHGQFIQYIGIKNEYRQHGLVLGECAEQTVVVMEAQIAPKPKYRYCLVHGHSNPSTALLFKIKATKKPQGLPRASFTLEV